MSSYFKLTNQYEGTITKMKPAGKPKFDLNWCVHKCMSDGRWWTFWDLQETIQLKTGKFYGEPTISAAIRNMRKPECRERFGLPLDMNIEIIDKKRIQGGKGYKYRMIEVSNYE